MDGYFSRNKKNKDKKETDVVLRDYENDLAEQRNRIFSLREENRALREELDKFKQNERYLSSMLINAQKAADKIVSDGEVMAAKKLFGAQEQEKRLKELISSYQAQLIQIEMQTSKLLSDIVETVAKIKQWDEDEPDTSARDILKSIAKITEPSDVA